MMTKSLSTILKIGYGLLILIAVILRFNNLGTMPLSEKEAAIALQSLTDMPMAGNLTGVNGFTTLLGSTLFILGKSEFIARLLPALFGTLLVFAPFLYRKLIGKEIAFILSVLMVFDPGLVAFSRQVDGAIITISGLVFAGGFLVIRKPVFAGIATGLALIGSPIIWPSILAAGFALWITFSRSEDTEETRKNITGVVSLEKNDWKNFTLATGITIVIFGSAFLTRIGGITAPILNFAAYIRGWLSAGEFPLSLILFSFVLYQPFVFLAGIIEGFRKSTSGDRSNTFLLWWFIFSLLLVVVYPSRGMDYLLITYIPLLPLAAKSVWRIILSTERPEIPALGQMVLVVLLVIFSWMNVIVLKFPIEGQDNILRSVAAVGSLVLLLVASLLIRMGWPPRQASTGLWMGLAILLAIFSFSTAWRAAGLGQHPQAELWNYDGITEEIDLLKRTAGDLGEWNINTRQSINIVILDFPSAALKWGLRDFENVKEDTELPNLSNPAVVITRNEKVPSLANSYRGQDFALTRRTSWSLVMPSEWIKWYAFRELSSETEQIILWARTDLFPGAAKTAPATINPIQ